MRLYVATENAGKLREIRRILAGVAPELEVLTHPAYRAPVEGEHSYTENAALKARALRARLDADADAGELGAPAHVVADDSGLEVVALGGRPGVLSARYAGATADWSERRRHLLDELRASDSTDRAARFVCAIHLIAPDREEISAVGVVDGEIAPEERGRSGFSYDAIFLYPPLGRTFGELSDEEKDAVSHRTRALRAVIAQLGERRRREGATASR